MMTVNLRKRTIPCPPPGVGATTTNQVSPGTFQEMYWTRETKALIDVALEEIAPDALHDIWNRSLSQHSRGLARCPPAGVGSQASHTPSTVSVRTPTPSPSPSMQRRQFTQRTLEVAAGAGGGDDDDGSGGSRRSNSAWTTRPRARTWWATTRRRTRTTPWITLVTCLQSSHPSRILDFWESTTSYLGSSGFTTTFTDDVTRSRTIGTRT